jgi:hypothetical protein
LANARACDAQAPFHEYALKTGITLQPRKRSGERGRIDSRTRRMMNLRLTVQR